MEAQAAIREARTADPRSPISYDAEGLLADLDQDKPRTTQAYAQAVELGSTNAYSHYRAAQLAWKAQADASTLAGLRQRLERAIELNDSFANAYSYLAEVLVQQGDGEGALVPAQRAVALEPGSPTTGSHSPACCTSSAVMTRRGSRPSWACSSPTATRSGRTPSASYCS